MTILTIAIVCVGTTLDHPSELRRASKALEETLIATLELAGLYGGQKKLVKDVLNRRTTLYPMSSKQRNTLTAMSDIPPELVDGINRAIELVASSSSALALENVHSTNPSRPYLKQINGALGSGLFKARFSHADKNFTLEELGVASNAGLGVTWEGTIVMEPNMWQSTKRAITGSALGFTTVVLNMPHDPAGFFALMQQNPKAIRFAGHGFSNRKVLRAVPRVTPEVADPDDLTSGNAHHTNRR